MMWCLQKIRETSISLYGERGEFWRRVYPCNEFCCCLQPDSQQLRENVQKLTKMDLIKKEVWRTQKASDSESWIITHLQELLAGVWKGRVFFCPPGERSGVVGGGIFLFCDLNMACFGEFCGAKFTVFLYRELPQWDSCRFCGKFWIFEQGNE